MEDKEFDYTKRKKKNTKRWCKGKHGVAHKVYHGEGKNPYNDEDKCAVCGKVVKIHWRINFRGWDDSCHKSTRNPK